MVNALVSECGLLYDEVYAGNKKGKIRKKKEESRKMVFLKLSVRHGDKEMAKQIIRGILEEYAFITGEVDIAPVADLEWGREVMGEYDPKTLLWSETICVPKRMGDKGQKKELLHKMRKFLNLVGYVDNPSMASIYNRIDEKVEKLRSYKEGIVYLD